MWWLWFFYKNIFILLCKILKKLLDYLMVVLFDDNLNKKLMCVYNYKD